MCDAPNRHDDLDLCLDCRRELPYLAKGVCRCCSLPLTVQGQNLCGQCQRDPPAYDQSVVLFHYAPPVDRLIQRLKYNGKLTVARTLGGLFANTIAQRDTERPDCIIPVPLHRNRLRRRGFNQALELARPAAKRIGTKIDHSCCNRSIDTLPQSTLPADERRKNVRRAFDVRPGTTWRRVAIFDDVMTTGQTVNALARALRSQGVEHISVWCIARAVL